MNIDLLNPFYIYKKRKRVNQILANKKRLWQKELRIKLRLFRSYLAICGIYRSSSDKHLIKLINCHKNKRCFVIGNGPSLRICDLQKLHENDEITFASNKIYVAYNDTEWRPTYYTVADVLAADNYLHAIKTLTCVKIFPDTFKNRAGNMNDGSWKGTPICFRKLHPNWDKNRNYMSNFSSNPLMGYPTGATVTALNIQLAVTMGCNPIYLIGVDGIYILPKKFVLDAAHGKLCVEEGEDWHFHKDYLKLGDTYAVPNVEYEKIDYLTCRKNAESRGIRIFNASRNSAIDIFERVDLDKIL